MRKRIAISNDDVEVVHCPYPDWGKANMVRASHCKECKLRFPCSHHEYEAPVPAPKRQKIQEAPKRRRMLL
jgi:hypothetical protein